MSESTDEIRSDIPKNKVVCIKTFGCQMNAYDSEVAAGLLKDRGYEIVTEYDGTAAAELAPGEKGPEWYKAPADVVIMNTCSVREHAEDRVFSRLGMLQVAKKEKPDLIVGLMGCMVEEHRNKLFRRFPHLDFMAGTRNVRDIPDLVAEVEKNRQQTARIKEDGIAIEYTDKIQRTSKVHAWLPIMTGCDKVCTFCIVPITRGAEVSMRARDVYRESSRLIAEGVTCLTLLGQNVNSYNGAEEKLDHSPWTIDKKNTPPSYGLSTMDYGLSKPISFPELLRELASIPGLRRLSFTTSHPQDATEELFQVIRDHANISRRFHLPLQSGSDKVLKRMKRLHTYAEYRDKIHRLRELVPDIIVTTDLITGFPGETEEDHRATMAAMEELQFEGAFIYKYSTRPGTPAAKLKDDVPESEKERRHGELFKLHKKIEKSCNDIWIGREVEVLLETASGKKPGFLKGRTPQDKPVLLEGSRDLLGTFAKARIDSLKHETFSGTLLQAESTANS